MGIGKTTNGKYFSRRVIRHYDGLPITRIQSNLLYDWMMFDKQYDERENPTPHNRLSGAVFWILYETIIEPKFGNKKYKAHCIGYDDCVATFHKPNCMRLEEFYPYYCYYK